MGSDISTATLVHPRNDDDQMVHADSRLGQASPVDLPLILARVELRLFGLTGFLSFDCVVRH